MRYPTPSQAAKLVGWSTALLLPFLFASEVFAQSGRRAQQTTVTLPDSSKPPQDLPTPTVSPELKRTVTILAARQPTSKHFVAEDAIYASFVNRLNENRSVHATSIGDLKRSQAVKRAQSEAEAIVVLLQFQVDSFQEGTILLNSRDLIVEYVVLEPLSGKQQSKGKVYYQQVGGGRLRKSEWPTGTPIKITTEATGIEAADQLYAWLLLKVGMKQ